MDWAGESGQGLAIRLERLVAVPATRALAPQLQACLESAQDYFLETDGAPPRPDAAEELVSEAEADEARQVLALVPRAGGPVVGLLDVHLDYPEPRVAHVGLLLFQPASRGRGYGREVVAALEAALAARGLRELRLSVVDENEGARLFWERLGFAEIGRLDRGVTVYAKAV